ncbi:Nephrocystin-3 [Fusarium oxysporum f. sp. cubense race 1]|uniref:Nephrocystin-3 n=1 Tax=Fusarium oxysporum f. sp. cubense (strain race 1) TaxID=1229664 RepID=N4V0E4_FUSC1|nr:Nephrocystin-3 [Fusarium oxysporum f. sp. cubense race 1]
MPPHSPHKQREISHNQFRGHTVIHQGNVLGKVYYGAPHPAARAEVIRVIPYPRNEDLVHRRDLIDRLDELLPQTSGSRNAALWGLGGSGKTQIALDYAYRRCDADEECCVFWVHANSEATFLADYKTIGKKLGIDERLDGTDLLDAVRNEIEFRSKWLMILDNTDDLGIFGVGQQAKGGETKKNHNKNLHKYLPCTSQGTVLWTSRDAHIAGTLVGARRGIEVRSMAVGEATTLLARIRDEPLTAEEAVEETGVDALLQELQCLPLAISQPGTYMRRMSMTAEQYLDLLRQGTTRWQVLKASDTDRHQRPGVLNSVLETWRISIERIRIESEISYRMLHVLAFVDSQDIPQQLIAAAAGWYGIGNESSTRQATELEFLEAVIRLRDFSFLNLRQRDDGRRSYEMHKLIQDTIRYGLRISGSTEMIMGQAPGEENELVETKNGETYYSVIALQVVDSLFPLSNPTSWAQCEQYVTHAIRVGEWAEVNGTEIKTATLLERASAFLYERGRWREKEPVDRRTWDLRRNVLGEKHPDTISSMASLAATYHAQGRYDEAERIDQEVLNLRREVLGESHPDTIGSMASLAATYHTQGRYDEAERIDQEVLNLRREVLGEKHPETIKSMADLAAMHHEQGRYEEAERLKNEALNLRREVLGGKHPDTLKSMASLAATHHAQGRYNKAQSTYEEVLDLRREVLGSKHLDTIRIMSNLASIYRDQGRWKEAEELEVHVIEMRKRVLGEEHPSMLASMANLASTYSNQGRWKEAEELQVQVVERMKRVLGEGHPDTLMSMANLASTHSSQRRWKEAEELQVQVVERMKRVLGEEHPSILISMANLASIYSSQRRWEEAEELEVHVMEIRKRVLGEEHPDTLTSMANLALSWKGLHLQVEAISMLDDCFRLRQRILGSAHPDTVYTRLTLDKWNNAKYELQVPNKTVSEIPASETSNSLWSIHEASTDPSSLSYEAFVSEGRVTEGRPTMTFFNYKKLETEQTFDDMYDDVESIDSISDDINSLVTPNLESADFRHAAVTYIVSMFLGDPELLTLYKQANQSVGEVKFVRNHRRLLKKYFLELRTERQTASQRSAVEFLRFRSNRTQISQGICNLIAPSKNPVQERLDTIIEQQKDSLVMLDRFLGERNALERPTPSETITETSALDDADPISEESDDEDDSIHELNSYQPTEDSLLFNLKSTAELFTTGRPFRVYQYHLRRFLNPHMATESKEIPRPDIFENHSRTPEEYCVEELSVSNTKFRMVMSSWWFWLMSFCLPLPAGYHRISYLCGCGRLSYLDVKELSPGGVDRFRRRIVNCASVARDRSQGPGVPSDQPNPPVLAHLRGAISPPFIISPPPQPITSRLPNIQAVHTLSQDPSSDPPQDPQYLLVCINAKYSPVPVHIEFQLIPIGERCHPGWFQKGQFPPETEVRAKRYLYEPVPREDIDVLHIPLPHLLEPGPHVDRFWITTFPKKLTEQLSRNPGAGGQRVIGWGIRINEELNWRCILLLLIIILVVTGISVITYALIASDGSSAFGMGAYLVAVLTTFITYQYFAWKDGLQDVS